MSEEMTREEAIEELSILLNKYQDGHFGDAIDMAIEDVDKCDKIEKIIDSNDADFIANYIRGLFAE